MFGYITSGRLLKGGLAAGLIGAVLGGVTSYLQMRTHLPLNKFDLSVAIPYENFSLYLGIGAGVVFGLVGLTIFLALFPRFQYPASTRLGAWLGFADGALLCLATSLILNTASGYFGYLPSDSSVLLSNTLITMAAGGVAGLCAGYLIADVGARNLG